MATDFETNIPHKMHPMGFFAPVALKVGADRKLMRTPDDRPIPERTADGQLMYALPGGGRWVPAAFLVKQAE